MTRPTMTRPTLASGRQDPSPARGRVVQTMHALPLGQAVSGALMICRPAPLAHAVSSAPSNTPPLWVLRLLGARLLAQGITAALWPRRQVAALSAGVDATHAASMVLAAVVEPRFRRPALISGAVALASALVSARAATSSQGRTR